MLKHNHPIDGYSKEYLDSCEKCKDKSPAGFEKYYNKEDDILILTGTQNRQRIYFDRKIPVSNDNGASLPYQYFNVVYIGFEDCSPYVVREV